MWRRWCTSSPQRNVRGDTAGVHKWRVRPLVERGCAGVVPLFEFSKIESTEVGDPTSGRKGEDDRRSSSGTTRLVLLSAPCNGCFFHCSCGGFPRWPSALMGVAACRLMVAWLVPPWRAGGVR